jgi:hypothetical protein
MFEPHARHDIPESDGSRTSTKLLATASYYAPPLPLAAHGNNVYHQHLDWSSLKRAFRAQRSIDPRYGSLDGKLAASLDVNDDAALFDLPLDVMLGTINARVRDSARLLGASTASSSSTTSTGRDAPGGSLASHRRQQQQQQRAYEARMEQYAQGASDEEEEEDGNDGPGDSPNSASPPYIPPWQEVVATQIVPSPPKASGAAHATMVLGEEQEEGEGDNDNNDGLASRAKRARSQVRMRFIPASCPQ